MREASDCLQVGARRAAYITVWLATAEALRRKFTEAQTFDGQAGQIVGEIQRREANHKAVDSLLITKAKDYGFISDAESQRLRHLYENRNIYGHPYEQSPSDAAVLAAAADAVEIVLGREVRLRHGYLDRQLVRLTADTAFLADDETAVANFAQQLHRRSSDDLHLWFLRKLLAALTPAFADASQDLLQRRGVRFLRAFLMVDPTIFDSWDATEDLPTYKDVLPGVLADKDLFDRVSDHAQDIVVNVLAERSPADPRYLELLWRAMDDGALADRHVAVLEAVLASMPLSRMVGRDLPLGAYWTKIVAGLATHSWEPQNRAVSALLNAGPDELAGLGNADQEELGRQVAQAADGNAWRAMDLLAAMPTASPSWPPKFVEGVAVEPFLAVDGQVRLKSSCAGPALRTLLGLDDVPRQAIFARIRDGVENGKARTPSRFFMKRDEVTAAIRDLATEPGLENAAMIADAIEAMELVDGDC